ncbi:ASCH domain-containing protein [Enterococcus pallens]|uniref:ASCH domain-containing protein n=1 Tax=Enterococcus pallens ATCC BAA-351 TaxID=1158607 RepID=R2QG52_9ENTE|nr:ASCH domain-containing protein [Enterococcus pallens]EOH94223.1 hypothetical protein UAU_01958 [Enterococcus pallens ATCC BAA-351]EOU24102.1 hypothetical protein I588_00089 [Enterococcus pallens ATCC BAA-351]
MKVLLSIKPEYVAEIADGSKRVEYRKSLFKRSDVSIVVVYATKPCGKIVGEFEIATIIQDRPDKLWQKTKDLSADTKESCDTYFQGRETGYGILIKKYVSYHEPRELTDYGIKTAPQSFCYLKE